jgi:class 3 adenylate cyclase
VDERSALDEAIDGLEALRGRLGSAAVDAAIEALRRHAAPAAAGPRLRQVSVLFADVADSTAMLGRVGAEDSADLLGRALQAFAGAVRRWDGEVLRFTGDGIKAAFGTRGLREDEAERAVRAGLQILADARAHAEHVRRELGVEGFGVRVGIHTGQVLLGAGAEAERSAMGQAVHLAARMEQSAPVGRLRVSDATWALVRGLFRASAQPPLLVKGLDAPLQTWLVEGVEGGPEPSVRRGVDGVAPPMIGRDAEFAQLLGRHRRAAAERRLGALLVLGDAGVGKTRLRLELLAALGLREGDAGLLQARAHPSGPLQPHGLLRQLLARWLGIPDDLSAAAARERLVAGLAPWLGAGAATQAPRIGHLIGLDFADHPAVQALGPAALRHEAFAALRAALHERARRTPLLLVLDDLHWADEASLAFVQELLLPADVPLFVLLLARPALRDRAVAIDAETLTLAPLPEADGRTLVAALLQPLPAPPPALCRLLLERADGNPFFLEALVRMLIDDGVIDAAGRPWRLHAERLAGLSVPSTLVGVLQARLDALAAPERAALQSASIVGPVFWDAALVAVDSLAPLSVPALEQRALVHPRSASAFAQTAEHAFAHQLLHDTTYATVLKAARREGHARVARWLAERVSDRAAEFLAITAQHFEHAGDSAQALDYWDLAQHSAYVRYANAEGLHFGERALAQPALADPRWRFVLLSHRHELLGRMDRTDEAAQTLAEMAAWAETCDDDAMRAEVSAARMLQADHAGRPDEAARLAAEALAHVQRAAGPEASSAGALAHGELAWLALQRQDFDETAAQVAAGLVHARVAAGVARRHGGYAGYEKQLRAIAIDALIEQDRYADALAAVHEGLTALQGSGGSLHDRFNLLLRQSAAQRELGRVADAQAGAEEALAIARTIGSARLQVSALLTVADASMACEDLERTAALLAEAGMSTTAGGVEYEQPRIDELRGLLAQARGDVAAARQCWQRAREQFAAQQRDEAARRVGVRLARLDLAAGNAAAARAAVDAALGAGGARLPVLSPVALLDCHRVLVALDDGRAAAVLAALATRLDAQLAALPDAAARERLLRAVPHWRAVHALRRATGR